MCPCLPVTSGAVNLPYGAGAPRFSQRAPVSPSVSECALPPAAARIAVIAAFVPVVSSSRCIFNDAHRLILGWNGNISAIVAHRLLAPRTRQALAGAGSGATSATSTTSATAASAGASATLRRERLGLGAGSAAASAASSTGASAGASSTTTSAALRRLRFLGAGSSPASASTAGFFGNGLFAGCFTVLDLRLDWVSPSPSPRPRPPRLRRPRRRRLRGPSPSSQLPRHARSASP